MRMWRTSGCRLADEVVSQADNGALTPSRRIHVENCGDCQDALEVAVQLGALSLADERQVSVPQAQYFWWKSQITQRLETQQLEARSLAAMQVISVAAALVLAAAAFSWSWPSLSGFVANLFDTLSAPHIVQHPAVPAFAAVSLATVLTVVCLVRVLLAKD